MGTDNAVADKMIGDLFAEKKAEKKEPKVRAAPARRATIVHKKPGGHGFGEYIPPLREKRELQYELIGDTAVITEETLSRVAESCYYAVLDRLDDFDIVLGLGNMEIIKSAMLPAVKEAVRHSVLLDDKRTDRKIKVRR